ncbi:hypothetical protein BH18ACI4_BH18ACI4_15590 [soil metagenome]
MTCRALIRRRLLNALNCPPKVMTVVTTVSDYMEALDNIPIRLGLEPLAELMGHPGQPKFAQRALDETQHYEKTANINLCLIRRGQRNVRRATEFSQNRLNDAAWDIYQKLKSDTRAIPTLAKIDEYTEQAITQFLRRPLATAQPRATRKPSTNTGGSVISSDKLVRLSDSGKAGLLFASAGFRVFPVDGKRPRVWNWKQSATVSENVIRAWSPRWPTTSWAVLCGALLPSGGFLTVIDKDRHGVTFGDGFKTVTMRENDLGPLPETFTVTTGGNGEHLYFSTTRPLPTTHNLLGPGLDIKSAGGFVVAPGSPGYEVTRDLPIEQLPTAWERALEVVHHPKKTITEGGRHDYLRATSYALACNGKGVDEILRTLRQRWEFNCEKRGRVISDDELQQLAVSAAAKVSRANYMLDLISA